MKLIDKNAVIVGGAGAIGKEIALKLAAEGTRTIILDVNPETAEYALDITDHREVERTMNDIAARFGHIDILVNSAGGSARGKNAPFASQSIEVIDWILGVNLHGPLYCIHAAAPYMIKQNYGKIINIASIVGMQGKASLTDYSAAKGGIIAATKSLALELGKYNINVNCVSPGIVVRPGEHGDDQALARRTTCLNRICTQADIANAVLFLALPESDFITGQNYVVDGGRSLGLKGD